MDAYTHLFYGLGQIVYAVSLADGKVQREEEQKLHDIVLRNLEASQVQFDYTDIIFKILKSDNLLNADQAYKEGMNNLKLGDHLLTKEMKEVFVNIVEEIAKAFPPKTVEEQEYVQRFMEDITVIG